MKKVEVHTACTGILGERINSLKLQLRELIEGARSDSKSTAGDKHETSRAMMQIEQEKLTNQLNVLLTHEQQLQRIDPSLQHQLVGTGCLMKTDQGWIYVSIPLGRIAVGDQFVMCLSPQSPLGAKLCGKKVGDAIEMNGTTYVIEQVA